MENKNPATPAQAATPGSNEQMATKSSDANQTSQPGGQGEQPEEKVTISLKEYRLLQRDKARVLSFEKRAKLGFSKKPGQSQVANGEGNEDPELLDQLAKSQEAQADADRRANRAEITLKVRDLLEKEEFKSLPASTKDLIMKNPAMLSDADNVEEALLDIEDFIRDQVIKLSVNTNVNQQTNQDNGSRADNKNPVGHETPPVVGGGSPAPTHAAELEDTSNLTGSARSRAILRNALKKGGKK